VLAAGPGRTRVECEWLFHADTPATPGLDPEDGIRFWDRTNREDWHVSELTAARRGVVALHAGDRLGPGVHDRGVRSGVPPVDEDLALIRVSELRPPRGLAQGLGQRVIEG